jgi:hypothetical protein
VRKLKLAGALVHSSIRTWPFDGGVAARPIGKVVNLRWIATQFLYREKKQIVIFTERFTFC